GSLIRQINPQWAQGLPVASTKRHPVPSSRMLQPGADHGILAEPAPAFQGARFNMHRNRRQAASASQSRDPAWARWAHCSRRSETPPHNLATALRKMHDHDRQAWTLIKHPSDRFCEEAVTGQDAGEARFRCRLHQVSVGQTAPSSAGCRFAANRVLVEYACQVHVHVGVKQPHAPNSLVRKQPSEPQEALRGGRNDQSFRRCPRGSCRWPSTRGSAPRTGVWCELPKPRRAGGDRPRSTGNPCKLWAQSPALAPDSFVNLTRGGPRLSLGEIQLMLSFSSGVGDAL